MTATHSLNPTASLAPVLYVAFELSNGQGQEGQGHALHIDEPSQFR
jgi:hypothetical protein